VTRKNLNQGFFYLEEIYRDKKFEQDEGKKCLTLNQKNALGFDRSIYLTTFTPINIISKLKTLNP
jgi:hypothetical protein